MTMYKDLNTKETYWQRLKRDPERYKKVNETRRAIGYAYKERHPDRVKNTKVKARNEKPWKRLIVLARHRCKKSGMEFNITEEYIESIWTDRCPVFGVPYCNSLREDPDYNMHWLPTIDRIDSSKGYVIGNVMIMSFRANSLKKDATVDELQKLVNFLESVGNDSGSCSSLDHQKPL
jgi:hypothetical protein